MSNEAPAAPTSAPQSVPTPDAPAAPLTVDSLAQALDNKNAPKAPQTAPTTPAEVKAEIKRIKQLNLKVYGQEMTEDLPFEMEDTPANREWMTKNLQMSKAAQRAMQEKGSFEQKVETFFQNLKGNTAEVLTQMGIDPVAFAAKQLEEEIARQQLSPEERKAQELEKKYKALEEETKRKEMEYRQREFQAKTQQIHDRIESQIISALDKSDLPQTPYVADRIAKYMSLGLQDPDGPVVLTPEEVLPLVREDIMKDIQSVIKGFKNPEDIENFVGKDVFSNVRKKNIAKLKAGTPATAMAAIKEVNNTTKKPESTPTKKISARTFFGI